jgi:prolyl-tRNA synthetase
MRQSHLFTKTRKEAPADETAKNAQLLIKAGYVNKEMAGVYSYLPLGMRVLQRIEHIVREEMDSIGGQEIVMATLHPSEPWKQTGAWDMVDVLFKIQSRTEKEYAMGQSEEEIVTPIAQTYITSYKDLPKAIYQIGNKYRDELRAKSGVMRGREFRMKDMYSFHASQEDFDAFYAISKTAYLKVFERCGLTAKATEASGGSFTQKLSYEFMVLTDAGEDDIVYCDSCTHCANVEVSDQKVGEQCKRCGTGTLATAKASEVGNIFDLGTRYTKAFDFKVKDAQGKELFPIMGCFGIGTTRLVGVIAEALSDAKGLVWPAAVAPFAAHLVLIDGKDENIRKDADALYDTLKKQGVSVLYDDRADVSAGEKFKDADLLGMPWRIVISARTIAAGQLECVKRATGETFAVNESDLIKTISA